MNIINISWIYHEYHEYQVPRPYNIREPCLLPTLLYAVATSWRGGAWSSWRWCPRWSASGPCPPWPSCRSMHLRHLTSEFRWCNRICQKPLGIHCWTLRNIVKHCETKFNSHAVTYFNSDAYLNLARSFVVTAIATAIATLALKVWRAFGTGINGHIQNLEALRSKQLDELDELDQTPGNLLKILMFRTDFSGLLMASTARKLWLQSPACTMLEETPE